MASNPYKNLVSNSLIFTLANFGSKIITFLMVPLYTYVLTPEAYGTIDIVTTTSGLMIPIIFLCISDAVMRYTMSSKFFKNDVLSNGMKIYFLGLILSGIIIFFLGNLLNVTEYRIFLFMILASNGLLLIFNQFLRSIGKIKEFAINGTLYTLTLVCSNIIFLVVLKIGIYGYFFSIFIANIICILYAFFISNAWKYLTFTSSNDVLKIMLRYSLPLIPNSLMWWIMDASDKFIISIFLGINANGIYAVSKKLPTIIDTFHSIFNQAWQISAIQENESKNTVEFTSNTYKVYTILIFSVVSFIMTFSQIIVKYFLSSSYFQSWKYIPLLLLSVAFSSLSGFLGANYIANEKTEIIFKTTAYGAIINTILNFLLIPIIEINGAALATMISFYIVLIIRENRIIKENKLIITFNRKIIYLLILIQFITYYIFPIWISFIAMIIIFNILLLYFKNTYITIIKKLMDGVRHEKK